ncbi:ankyrin repeat domain-containing protein 34B-like [Mytilus edulis]|uniref:ankyrin repeat domain-containing protein 34B-like n=1 Tax=Mytilus edulis TaxID=6550 RepID=UPI0039EFF3ED
MENKLLWALESGKFKLAKILIQGGHDVNFCTDAGTSPLMIACKLFTRDQDVHEKLEIISTLLANKANINAIDNKGRTALAYAMHARCKATIQMLKNKGLFITIDAKMKRMEGSDKKIWNSFDLEE